MNLTEFAAHTDRTWRAQSQEQDLLHVYLGLGDELGELKSCLKKKVGYGKALDTVNLLEEGGDFAFFLIRGWLLFDDPKNLKTFKLTVKDEHVSDKVVVNMLASMSRNVEGFYVAFTANDADSSAIALTFALRDLITILSIHGYTLEQALEANIAKLKARYPEGWSEEKATNRNKQAERDILASHC